MNKTEFNSLELLDQISYINQELLTGESLRTICTNMDMGKTTIVNRFTKAKYVFNASTRQYEYQEEQMHQEEVKTPPVKQEVAISDNLSEVKKPFYSIPIKQVEKPNTQSFTITVKKTVISKIDKLVKKKGYKTRNELINVMIEMVLGGLEE